MRFVELRLRVCDIAATSDWYESLLELPVQRDSDCVLVRFYSDQSAALRFLPASNPPKPAQPPGSRSGFVWVGLAGFPDVVATAESLTGRGLTPKIQGQFEDVGFVAHMPDLNNITLELLQTKFEANFTPQPLPANVLRADAVLGQAKFNVKCATANMHFYSDLLGMKLLSTQRVKYSFTLYFLAFTDDELPNADTNSVDNREWLWQRQYTQVELQHFDGDPDIYLPEKESEGLDSIVFEGAAQEVCSVKDRLTQAGVHVDDHDNGGFSTLDPDGRTCTFVCIC